MKGAECVSEDLLSRRKRELKKENCRESRGNISIIEILFTLSK
jgi:hypothetical protein